MDAFVKWMDSQSRLVKLLLCLPIVDILWGLYRLFGAIKNHNVLHIVLAALWILWAGYVGWVLDLVFIILFNHICWFRE